MDEHQDSQNTEQPAENAVPVPSPAPAEPVAPAAVAAPAPPAPAASQSVPVEFAQLSPFKKVERVTAWILIISAALFALIGIASIWGAFGEDSDVVWRALGSLGVIAFAALIVNVGAKLAEGHK